MIPCNPLTFEGNSPKVGETPAITFPYQKLQQIDESSVFEFVSNIIMNCLARLISDAHLQIIGPSLFHNVDLGMEGWNGGRKP